MPKRAAKKGKAPNDFLKKGKGQLPRHEGRGLWKASG